METTKETWVDIKGYKGLYQVSNMGRIKSLPKKWKAGCGATLCHCGKILKIITVNRYLECTLTKNGKRKNLRVHTIVLESFIGKRKGFECNHIDGNKRNNNLSNLEWVKHVENLRHSMRLRLQKRNNLGRYEKGENYIC